MRKSTKKKNKQLIQLCVLAGVLAVLAAIFVAVKIWNTKAEKAAEEAENATVDVPFLEDKGDAATLSVTNEQGTETYVYDAENEQWRWAEDENFPLNSSYISSLINTWDVLSTSTPLEITDDLSAYGLDPAVSSATVSTEDGESITILIGNATGDYYYSMIEGGDTIYLISSTMYSYTNYTLYDMATLEVFPTVDSDSLQSITVSGAVETALHQEFTEVEAEEEEAEETAETTDSSEEIAETTGTDEEETTTETVGTWYTAAGTDLTDAGDLTELTSEVIGLSFASMVNYYPTEEDRTAAGLDAPQCVLTVTYTSTTSSEDEDTETTETKSFTLEIGSSTDDASGYYATINGGSTIYTIAQSDVAAILNVALGGADALFTAEE